MSWSIGEIAGLAAKAARGSGRPWGVAEEIGAAVRWLSAQGLPGPEVVSRWLAGGEGDCPVALGLSISDTGDIGLVNPARALSEPMLLLPFIARVIPDGMALEIGSGRGSFALWRGGTDLGGPLPPGSTLEVRGETAMPQARRGVSRVALVEEEALASLRAWAARTYAPSTEESRLKGAGAGLTDND